MNSAVIQSVSSAVSTILFHLLAKSIKSNALLNTRFHFIRFLFSFSRKHLNLLFKSAFEGIDTLKLCSLCFLCS